MKEKQLPHLALPCCVLVLLLAVTMPAMSRAASVFPQDATQLHIPQDGPNQGSEAPNTTWHIETADDRADLILAKHTSLALDSSSKPYITYCWVSSFNCDGLYLARYDGSIWHSTVLSGPYNGAHNSVAIGSEDHPHISAVQELSKEGCTAVVLLVPQARYAAFTARFL